MIASHYAEPVERMVAKATDLRSAPSDNSDAMASLSAGEQYSLLNESLGWAWGYRSKDRRVGYIRSDALAPR